jgi:hypothetical protein
MAEQFHNFHHITIYKIFGIFIKHVFFKPLLSRFPGKLEVRIWSVHNNL